MEGNNFFTEFSRSFIFYDCLTVSHINLTELKLITISISRHMYQFPFLTSEEIYRLIPIHSPNFYNSIFNVIYQKISTKSLSTHLFFSTQKPLQYSVIRNHKNISFF